MIEITAALISAGFLIALSQGFKKYIPHRLAASTILIAIAFIYVGFALQGNTASSATMEIIAAVVFYIIAVTGYLKYEKLLPAGIILHGVWDIAHHLGFSETRIPDYYPVFCLSIDFVIGIYFWIIFSRRK